MHTLTFRQAGQADAQAITALVNEAYTPYIARIGKPPAPMLEDYGQVIAQSEVYVALQQAQVVGVLVMGRADGDMLLVNVAVLPSCKGQGIGKALLQLCERHARQAGCEAIRLYTHERMTENLAIYRKQGFEETHRAHEHGFARVFMRKVLTAAGE
ncbi:GNAT family N-acetyltransferase [Pseudomonas sp. PSKL.D1]|uniref:GNAT family N-acetyltransferase n=1 Tax=Pseudomonas sp. PSKL.D1 TaxID=3029060 RepID=UPI0023815800|nr:GNAT family N-acetyltransferase [Pseudomonas sp. PSKL.D1]WDY60079.1 GNAT family N-acetyltransferase [Pseudomonas sp. PSKL.D1]